MEILDFLVLWVSRAATETLDFLGWNRRTGVVAIITVALGFLMYWKMHGKEAAARQFRDYAALSAWPLMIVVAVLLGTNFLMAPYMLYLELEQRHSEELSTEITSKLLPKDRKLQENRETIQKLQQRIKELEVSNKRVGQPPAELDQRNKRKEIADRLAVFLTRGNGLVGRCIRERCSEEVESATNEWYRECFAYIQENLGAAYAARFNDLSGLLLSDYPIGFPIGKASIYNAIRGRNVRLNEFLRELAN